MLHAGTKENVPGVHFRYQSMQEKLPVASSLYRMRSILMCGNSGKNVFLHVRFPDR